jgi:hypothetical protein
MKAFASVLVGIVMAATPASAGVALKPAQLNPNVRTRLAAEIQAARAQEPRAFQQVAALRAKLPELDRSRRGRLVPVSSMLKSIGKPALMPMIEMLAFDPQADVGLSEEAALSLRVGLIEAVGMIRDERAAPVMQAILRASNAQPQVVRAAAEALGRLGDDASAKHLVGLASVESPQRLEILAGMGGCRRAVCVQALANAARSPLAEDEARTVAKALGEAANAWAWRTSALAKHPERERVRNDAAAALVDLVVRYSGGARDAASTALLVVDSPSAPALIAAAKTTADATTVAALTELEQRLANNPLR